jgi:hypothetical protein
MVETCSNVIGIEGQQRVGVVGVESSQWLIA